MSDLFKAKIRRVGTSLGILIPKGIIEEEKIKAGQEVKVSLLKQRKLEEVLRLMGTAKGARPFVRDRTDRSERY